MRGGTNQQWRTPLRAAIASLAEGLHEIYEREGRRYFDDPWAVRDAYGEVVATPDRIEQWVRDRVKPAARSSGGTAESPVPSPQSPALSPQSLLEMERGALRIFTSCAWFFDDIGGLEPIEVLRYAARAIELAGPAGSRLEEAFIARLADATSNDPSIGSGRDVYLTMAKPTLGQFARLAGSVAAARAVAADDSRAREASRALDVRASDDSVTIRQHRTGEQATYLVWVTGLPDGNEAGSNEVGAAWSAVLISARLAEPPVDVSLSEMTERQRAVVEDGIRERLVAVAFGDDAPTLDSHHAADVLSNAITGTVAALGQERNRNLTRMNALLDLLEIERLHVPFDAQTTFYETFLGDGAKPPSPEVSALGVRLGFSSTLPTNT